MATAKKRGWFLESEEGAAIAQILRLMHENSDFDTHASYSANTERYPNNLKPFVDMHMDYLSAHPSIDPTQYVSNLRLRTRVRIAQPS